MERDSPPGSPKGGGNGGGGKVAGPTGLEPATSGVTGLRSNQLSYDPDVRPFALARREEAEYTEVVLRCKSATILVLAAVWAAPATASEGMRILTFVPGVANDVTHEDGIRLVTGSLYLVGEAKKILKN